jgi:molybdate transport system substrate-binding protein
LPVKGITLVGPLPAEIQNYTSYAGGVATSAKDAAVARSLVTFMSGPRAASIIKAKGMQPASVP